MYVCAAVCLRVRTFLALRRARLSPGAAATPRLKNKHLATGHMPYSISLSLSPPVRLLSRAADATGLVSNAASIGPVSCPSSRDPREQLRFFTIWRAHCPAVRHISPSITPNEGRSAPAHLHNRCSLNLSFFAQRGHHNNLPRYSLLMEFFDLMGAGI